MNDQNHAARLLKALRERSGLSIRAVAEALGMPLSTYSSYERTYKRQYLPMELVMKLIQVFIGKDGIVTPDVLALGMPQHQIDSSMDVLADSLGTPLALLGPILEEKQARDVGYDRHKALVVHPVTDMISIRATAKNERYIHFALLDLVTGAVPRPPGVGAETQTFAFFAPDDRMSPRWRRGEIVFVEPYRSPVPGDHALLFHKPHKNEPEQVYFARYALATNDYIAMEFYTVDAKSNGAQFIGLPPTEVTSIWRVLEWSDLIG